MNEGGKILGTLFNTMHSSTAPPPPHIMTSIIHIKYNLWQSDWIGLHYIAQMFLIKWWVRVHYHGNSTYRSRWCDFNESTRTPTAWTMWCDYFVSYCMYKASLTL